MAKKRVKKTRKPVSKKMDSKKKKIAVLLNNLLLFIALSLVSLVLTQFSSGNAFFVNLFSVLTVVFGFIALAFLIVFLVLILVRALSKK